MCSFSCPAAAVGVRASLTWQDLAALQAKVQEVTDLKARDAQVSADALKQLRTASDAAEKVSCCTYLCGRDVRTSFVVCVFSGSACCC